MGNQEGRRGTSGLGLPWVSSLRKRNLSNWIKIHVSQRPQEKPMWIADLDVSNYFVHYYQNSR